VALWWMVQIDTGQVSCPTARSYITLVDGSRRAQHLTRQLAQISSLGGSRWVWRLVQWLLRISLRRMVRFDTCPASCLHQEKIKLRPEHPDALDALDVSDATCLTRMQIAMAPYIWMQIATASSYQTKCGRAFSFWTQPCQGIFLLNTVVSGHFPSGRSRVRVFSYWTRPDDVCHGSTVTLAVKALNVAANTRVTFANR